MPSPAQFMRRVAQTSSFSLSLSLWQVCANKIKEVRFICKILWMDDILRQACGLSRNSQGRSCQLVQKLVLPQNVKQVNEAQTKEKHRRFAICKSGNLQAEYDQSLENLVDTCFEAPSLVLEWPKYPGDRAWNQNPPSTTNKVQRGRHLERSQPEPTFNRCSRLQLQFLCEVAISFGSTVEAAPAPRPPAPRAWGAGRWPAASARGRRDL